MTAIAKPRIYGGRCRARPFLPVAQLEALRRMSRNIDGLKQDRAGWATNNGLGFWRACSGTVFALERKGFCVVTGPGNKRKAGITRDGRAELRRHA